MKNKIKLAKVCHKGRIKALSFLMIVAMIPIKAKKNIIEKPGVKSCWISVSLSHFIPAVNSRFSRKGIDHQAVSKKAIEKIFIRKINLFLKSLEIKITGEIITAAIVDNIWEWVMAARSKDGKIILFLFSISMYSFPRKTKYKARERLKGNSPANVLRILPP